MQGIDRASFRTIEIGDRPLERHGTLRRADGGHGLLAPLVAAVQKGTAALARWRTRRAARRDLDSLPDWALKDIGLARADISRVADAITDRLRDADPSRRPKIKPQSLVRNDPITRHVRVISGCSSDLAGCG